jgi:hypothetical protein
MMGGMSRLECSGKEPINGSRVHKKPPETQNLGRLFHDHSGCDFHNEDQMIDR